MYVSLFGTLKMLVEQIIADKSCLKNELFLKCLSAAALDFFELAHKFNGGNESGWNIRREGKTIDAVQYICCCVPEREGNQWDGVLADIEYITEMVEFEFANNIIQLHPMAPSVTYRREEYKYKDMPRS